LYLQPEPLLTSPRIDLLHAVSFNARLRFVKETAPVSRAKIPYDGEGNFFASSPLVVFNDQDFSLLPKFIDAEVADRLASVLGRTFETIEQVYRGSATHGPGAVQVVDQGLAAAGNSPTTTATLTPESSAVSMYSAGGAFPDLDELADPCTLEGGVPGIILQSCVLASRIFFRTLDRLDGLEDRANATDMRALHRNLRFLGLRSWAGLPYIYAWLYVTLCSMPPCHCRCCPST
jgi:hypothetical protein